MSGALDGAVKAVAPYIAVGGLAYAAIKSGVLGKMWESLTGQFGKTSEEVYSSLYNNSTIENIRNVTNMEWITKKNYTQQKYYDPLGEEINWDHDAAIANSPTTEGRTFIDAGIPGDYGVTVLGEAKTAEELLSNTKGMQVTGGREIAWWDPFGWVAGAADWFDNVNPFVASAAEPIGTARTVKTNVYDMMSGDEKRNYDAWKGNEERMQEAISRGSSDPMEYLSKEYSDRSNPEAWPTPQESTLPYYGSDDVEKALTGEVKEKAPEKEKTHEITPEERDRGYVGH